MLHIDRIPRGYKYFTRKPTPLKVYELKEPTIVESDTEDYHGYEGDFVVDDAENGIYVICKEDFTHLYEEFTGRKAQKKFDNAREKIIEELYEETLKGMSEEQKNQADQACKMIEKCKLIKLNLEDKKNLYLISQWVLDYPQLNIVKEIKAASDWMISKGRFKSNFRTFLSNWIKKNADKR